MDLLREAFSIFPVWVYVLWGVIAVILGRLFRHWMDKKELREQERLREKRKRDKKLMKRAKKLAKKKSRPAKEAGAADNPASDTGGEEA